MVRNGKIILLTSRIQSIDVQTQINWVLSAHTIPNLLDDTIRPDGIDLAGLDDLEPAISVVFVVTRSAQCSSDPRVDVGVVLE